LGDGATRFDFEGRTVVVTGGSRGIGRAICEAFAAAGARVRTCSRRGVEVPFDHGTIESEIVDVRDPEASAAWLDRCAREAGGIDVLVNNAGGGPSVATEEASPRLTAKVLELNLTAPLVLCQQAHPHMVGRDTSGVIVNVVSLSSVRPTPRAVAYGAAKAGLMNATASLAVEWGPKIRVNCIVCGLVETELTEGHYGDEAQKRAITDAIPAARFARPDDVAHACLFLAARDSSYVSGASLEVTGGGEWPPTIPHAPVATDRAKTK
jgi:NAD(P)-dependent dehydrogenase (short-subunit alcohol dehydrogenase family)